MAIKRTDVEAGRADFSDVADLKGARIPPTYPGEILREEFLDPLHITPYRLAKDTGMSPDPHCRHP